jgi:hypothetical protein
VCDVYQAKNLRKFLSLVLLCGCLSTSAKTVEPAANPPTDTEYRQQLTRDLTAMSLRIYQLEQRIIDLESKKHKKK